MRSIQSTVLAGAVAAGLGVAARAEPPPALTPRGIAGSGFNVRDLEGEKAWYTGMLGMRLINTYNRDGKPFEYIVGYDGEGASILALLLTPARPAGPNGMGRLILSAPDAKGLSEHLKARGVPVREAIPGVAYFVTDPEGNPVELYTPPAPAR